MTIIVLLILAGVSLNAIVGDNGIITNAMSAKQKQGIAALEEFLQQKYVESFDKIEKNGVEYTPLEVLLKVHPNYFYHDGSKDYTVKQVTHVAQNGETQTDFFKIRLIRKIEIPKEIQETLVGGDAIGRDGKNDSYDAYDQLLDVYGVTNDLKVFYCSNGLETSGGADYLLSEAYDSGKVLYGNDSPLSQAVSSTYGESAKDLTLKDLLSVTELTIDPSLNINNLSFLADLQNLTKLTLVNYEGTLSGIERAYNLTYIYFSNSLNKQNIDFQGFEGANSLNEIRFYNPTDTELEKMCSQMENTDYNSLEKIYLYGGWDEYWANWNTYFYSVNGEANLESITYLDKLSTLTKNVVKKIMICNTKISSLDGIETYKELRYLRIYKNHLKNLDELTGLTFLTYLDISNNSDLDDINGISSIGTLSYIFMRFVPNLTDISPTIISSSPIYVDALSNTNFDFNTEAWKKDDKKLIAKLEKVGTLLLEAKYSLLFINKDNIVLAVDHTWADVSVLKNKTNIITISFNGNKNLTDGQIQELLSSLPNVKNINLDDTNLESLDFVSNGSLSLNRISFYNTKVTDITPLYGQSVLGFIRFGVYKTNNIVTHRVELHRDNDEIFNNKIISIIETSYDKALSEMTNIPHGGGFIPADESYWLELNKLTNLTKFYMRWYNCPESYNFDFSATHLRSLNIQMNNGATIKVPHTLETIYSVFRLKFQATRIDNLKDIGGNGGALIICDDINTVFDDTQNGVIVHYGADTAAAIETDIPYYAFDWVGSFSHKPDFVGGGKIGTFSSNMISPMINCNYFDISCKNVSRLDGNDFLGLTREFTFILDGCNVTTFDNVNVASKLKILKLPNNRISDVSFFVDNYQQSNLQELYLGNNKLENLTTYKNSDGASVNMKTTDILGRLPNLRYVDLSRNNSLTDFSGLLNAGFHETGDNTKIFTK